MTEKTIKDLQTGVDLEILGSVNKMFAANLASNSILQAGSASASGSAMTAEALRNSQNMVRKEGVFNQGIQNINVKRNLQATSRQYSRLLGSL